MTDVRDQIVRWGKWGVTNHSKFTYTEGPTRMEGVHKPGVLPWQGDFSAWVTCCYSWSKAPDPNGLNYDGEGYCFSPDTRVLTSDLRWVPAGNIEAGDELWAFEETASDPLIGRTIKRATVVASFPSVKDCVEVTIDTGESFVCSADHPWLSAKSFSPGAGKLGLHNWTKAADLMNSPELVRPFIPWESDRSYDAGWLAGIFDGEGWTINRGIRGGRTNGIGITQVLGPIEEKIEILARKYGDWNRRVISRDGLQKRADLTTRGGFSQAASFIGTIRAERLIANFEMTGGHIQKKHPARVVSVVSVGEREVQSIQTSEGTYFAEGFAVHNTGTLLSHGKKITLKEALPGDIVVFGPGTGVHAALIVEITPQIICSSMGKPGDPSLVSLRELESLGVATFLRNITQEIQVPTLDPTPTQISNAHLTMLHNPTQAKIAEANGWRVLLWNGFHFIPATAEVPAGVLVYSNIHWNIKR